MRKDACVEIWFEFILPNLNISFLNRIQSNKSRISNLNNDYWRRETAVFNLFSRVQLDIILMNRVWNSTAIWSKTFIQSNKCGIACCQKYFQLKIWQNFFCRFANFIEHNHHLHVEIINFYAQNKTNYKQYNINTIWHDEWNSIWKVVSVEQQ